MGSNIAVNAEVFVAAPDAALMACVFDYSGLCNNVINHPKHSSLSFIHTLGSADENVCSSPSVVAGVNMDTDSCVATSMLGDEVVDASSAPVKPDRQYFKKRSRKLCRKLHRSQTCDCKRSSFDYGQYSHPTTNQDEVTQPVARILPNQGHSPTKAEVKKMNQRLIDENHCLKKDFHKADHCLKTLLADKKDLLR